MLSKRIDLVIAHEAIGKLPVNSPSRTYIKRLKKLGAAFVQQILCRQLQAKIDGYLMGKDLKVEVVPESLRVDVPDKDPRTLYVYYPSLLEGAHGNQGVLAIDCSIRAAALDTE